MNCICKLGTPFNICSVSGKYSQHFTCAIFCNVTAWDKKSGILGVMWELCLDLPDVTENDPVGNSAFCMLAISDWISRLYLICILLSLYDKTISKAPLLAASISLPTCLSAQEVSPKGNCGIVGLHRCYHKRKSVSILTKL